MAGVGITFYYFSCDADSNVVVCSGCSLGFCVDHIDFYNHSCNLGIEAVTDEYRGCLGCREKTEKIRDLEDMIESLNQKKHESKRKFDQVNDQLREVQAKLFEVETNFDQTLESVSDLNDLRKENQLLSENILIMGELYQRTKEKLDSLTCFNISNEIIRQQFSSNKSFSSPTTSSSCLLTNMGMSLSPSLAASKKIERLERELERLTKERDDYHRDRDYFRGKSSEYEILFEDSVAEWTAKLNVEKERISGLEAINRVYETQIKSLNDKLKDNSQVSKAENQSGTVS